MTDREKKIEILNRMISNGYYFQNDPETRDFYIENFPLSMWQDWEKHYMDYISKD